MATVGTSANESLDEYLILAWGANSYGQLGLGHTRDITSPAPLHFVDKITQLCGGGGHSMFLLDDGQIYGCGWNKCHQTGIAESALENILLPIKSSDVVADKISCGWNHTLIIKRNSGILLVCGSNSHGQLGLPQTLRQTMSPEILSSKMFGDSKVIDVACGLRHSAAVTDDGSVYTWGNNKRGQLGHGMPQGGTPSPGTITVPELIISLRGIKCTRVSAMAHNTAICTEDGSLYVCGCNAYGQCCLNNMTDKDNNILVNEMGVATSVYAPIKVDSLPPVTEISCGWSHIIAITVSERRVFGWGRCDYGQLGLGDDLVKRQNRCVSVPTEIVSLRGVKQIKCGSEHCIAIGKDDNLMTWGWNEHGMCGTGNETNVTTPCEITLTPPTSDHTSRLVPVLVGTGAGHSMTIARVIKQD